VNGLVHKAVIAPDLLAGAFFDPICRRVLTQWRNGLLKPVLNRELLIAYLKILHKLGLRPEDIQRWTAWFTSNSKVVYLGDLIAQAASGWELCRAVASAELECAIISWRLPEDQNRVDSSIIFTADEWIRKVNGS
jgi:hypothetical protein